MANRRELAETNPVKLKIADRITELVFRFPNIHNFSAATGLSEAGIEHWLNGDASPNMQSLYRLSCLMHVSMQWLLGMSDIEQYAGLDFTEHDDVYNILRDRITILVDECGSVWEFSARVQIGRLSVYRWLSGDSVPNAETVSSVCQRCGVSADWVFGLTDNPGRPLSGTERSEE